jgi:hypothetical protein
MRYGIVFSNGAALEIDQESYDRVAAHTDGPFVCVKTLDLVEHLFNVNLIVEATRKSGIQVM